MSVDQIEDESESAQGLLRFVYTGVVHWEFFSRHCTQRIDAN